MYLFPSSHFGLSKMVFAFRVIEKRNVECNTKSRVEGEIAPTLSIGSTICTWAKTLQHHLPKVFNELMLLLPVFPNVFWREHITFSQKTFHKGSRNQSTQLLAQRSSSTFSALAKQCRKLRKSKSIAYSLFDTSPKKMIINHRSPMGNSNRVLSLKP